MEIANTKSNSSIEDIKKVRINGKDYDITYLNSELVKITIGDEKVTFKLNEFIDNPDYKKEVEQEVASIQNI